MFLYVNCSDINTIINEDRKYGNFNATFIKIFSKCHNDIKRRITENYKEVKEINIDINDDDELITKFNNIIFNKKLLNCSNVEQLKINISKIQKKCKVTTDQVKENDQIKKMLYTNYGIKYENKALQTFSKLYKINIIIDKSYHKKFILENFMIGGRIDGITQNNEIIEVKCRTNRLYDYLFKNDKIQLMTYLYIFGFKKGYLVQYLKNDKSNIRVFNVKYNESYYKKNVLSKLIKFYHFYKYFLTNEELKKDLIDYQYNKDSSNFKLEDHFIKFTY